MSVDRIRSIVKSLGKFYDPETGSQAIDSSAPLFLHAFSEVSSS